MKIAFLSLFFFLCLAGSSIAEHAPNCMPSLEDMTEFLQTTYQEGVVFSGVNSSNFNLTMTLAPDGTWSVMATDPDTDETCLAVVGEGGEIFKPPVAGKDL